MPTHHTTHHYLKIIDGLGGITHGHEKMIPYRRKINHRLSKTINGQRKMTNRQPKVISGLEKIIHRRLEITNSHQKIIPRHIKIIDGQYKNIPGQPGIANPYQVVTTQQLGLIGYAQSIFKFKPDKIMKDQSIDGKLLFAQNAITNAINTPEITESLTLFGYDQPRLEEGKLLYTTASDQHTRQIKEYGEQFAATDSLRQSYDLANKEYMVHLKVARVALKGDRGLAESLQMTGSRKESLSGWLGQAKAFYQNALAIPSVLTAVERFGISPEKLTATQQLVLDVEEKLNAQLKEKGEAQTATQNRDRAFDELQDWMGDFISIAKIALEEDPQRLETLGIIEKS